MNINFLRPFLVTSSYLDGSLNSRDHWTDGIRYQASSLVSVIPFNGLQIIYCTYQILIHEPKELITIV